MSRLVRDNDYSLLLLRTIHLYKAVLTVVLVFVSLLLNGRELGFGDVELHDAASESAYILSYCAWSDSCEMQSRSAIFFRTTLFLFLAK